MQDPRALTLVASDVAPIGGMERVAYELVRRLVARGWHVTVLARTCALPTGPRLDFVRLRSPARPVSIALVADLVQAAALLAARRRRGIVQTNNPTVLPRVDVITVHFCETAYRARVGVSRSRRSHPLFRLNSWLASRIALALERWCYRPGRVRRAACVSAGVARELRDFHPRVAPFIQVIPNGVDRAAFDAAPAVRARTRAELGLGDGPVGLFVGGDWHRKGLRHAIEGVAAAPPWRLVVAGDGDRERFAALAAERGAGDRVVFAGRVADPQPVYAAADALVLPTAYEAFSLVTLEAAASGLALLVPPVNGTDELVEDGVNGFLVERDGAAIAARLRELGADPARLGRMGQAARAASEPFDWERVVDAYEALYAELAG